MNTQMKHDMNTMYGTTIVAVRKAGTVVIGGDGQVTLGHTVMKHNAIKVRRLHDESIIAGFAGSTADAFTLFELFDGKLNEYRGNLVRAAIELAKEWRRDRILRRLEALLLVADSKTILVISGNGDVIEPQNDAVAIGSGGGFAEASARALLAHSDLDARAIVEHALAIAADMCIYTNHTITVESLTQPAA